MFISRNKEISYCVRVRAHTECICNQVHLHIVFVLLYSVCSSLNVTVTSFFFCAWTSINLLRISYVLFYFNVTQRRRVREREEKRVVTPIASRTFPRKLKLTLKNLWLWLDHLLFPTSGRLV